MATDAYWENGYSVTLRQGIFISGKLFWSVWYLTVQFSVGGRPFCVWRRWPDRVMAIKANEWWFVLPLPLRAALFRPVRLGLQNSEKKTESKNIDSPSRKGYWSVRSRSRRRGWWWPTQVVFLKPFWIPFCVTICANPFSQSHFQSIYTRDVKADVSVGWSEMQYSVMRDDPKGIAIWMRRRRLAFGE